MVPNEENAFQDDTEAPNAKYVKKLFDTARTTLKDNLRNNHREALRQVEEEVDRLRVSILNDVGKMIARKTSLGFACRENRDKPLLDQPSQCNIYTEDSLAVPQVKTTPVKTITVDHRAHGSAVRFEEKGASSMENLAPIVPTQTGDSIPTEPAKLPMEAGTSEATKMTSWISFASLKSFNEIFTLGGGKSTKRGMSIFQSVAWDTAPECKEANFLPRLIHHNYFEFTMTVCIIMSCLAVGLQSHQKVVGDLGEVLPTSLNVMEHILTGVFLTELAVMTKVSGLRHFSPITDSDTQMNLFDALIVLVAGLLCTWIIPLFSLMGLVPDTSFLKIFHLLKALRLVRLVRVVRRVPMLRGVWKLIQGVSGCFRVMCSALLVTFLTIYTFAIVGLTLVVGPLQELNTMSSEPSITDASKDLLAQYGGLGKLMLTLCKGMTADGFTQIIDQTTKLLPFSWIYFLFFQIAGYLVLMNLVTAVIVENAAECAAHDREQVLAKKVYEQTKTAQELKELFKYLDVDRDGFLVREELEASFSNPHISPKWAFFDVRPHDCEELFDLLDDGDHQIDCAEFFNGLLTLQGGPINKDLLKMQRSINHLIKYVHDVGRSTHGIETNMRRSKPKAADVISSNTTELF